MSLTERQALLGQVVGNVSCGKVTLLRLSTHCIGVHLHGGDHALHADQAVVQGLAGIHNTFLVFLEVLVIGQRKALHGGKQRHKIAHYAAGLAADELGEVGVLLLRHDR